jgi:hypothetical protein
MTPKHDLLARTLARLIETSDAPRDEMELVSQMLFDAGGMNWRAGPRTSPLDFAMAIFENPGVVEAMEACRVIIEDPSALETPEQLINSLLPASSA